MWQARPGGKSDCESACGSARSNAPPSARGHCAQHFDTAHFISSPRGSTGRRSGSNVGAGTHASLARQGLPRAPLRAAALCRQRCRLPTGRRPAPSLRAMRSLNQCRRLNLAVAAARRSRMSVDGRLNMCVHYMFFSVKGPASAPLFRSALQPRPGGL